MEVFDAISGVFTVVGSMAAAFVAWLASRTYRDLSPAGQLRRRQDEYMLELSAATRQMFELMHEFEKWVQGMTEFQPFLVPTLKQLSQHLIELLGEANILGLGHFVVGNRGLRWMNLIAFRSSLATFADLQQERITEEEYKNANFIYGMVRLAHTCIAYELSDATRASTKGSSLSVGASFEALKRDIEDIMVNSFMVYEKNAWDYMERA